MTTKEIEKQIKQKLERQLKNALRKINSGDSFQLMYEGEEIARYDYDGWSPDCKTPIQWLRLCFVFEIDLRGRDLSKVELVFTKG